MEPWIEAIDGADLRGLLGMDMEASEWDWRNDLEMEEWTVDGKDLFRIGLEIESELEEDEEDGCNEMLSYLVGDGSEYVESSAGRGEIDSDWK